MRGGYGLALLAAPGPLQRLLVGCGSETAMRRVVRVLGARQLAQSVLSMCYPVRTTRIVGSVVDLAHAASMLALAVSVVRYRRAAALDAAIAAGFAVAGVAAARRTV